jgi:hypothetical protein
VKNISNILIVATLCGLLSILGACSGKSGQTASQSDQGGRTLSSVVILPAEAAQGDGGNAGDLLKGAEFVNLKIAELTQDYGNVRVLSQGQVNDLMDEDNTDNTNDVVAHLHKVLHCDAVMMVTVHRYRQRQGGDLAADSPASASFQIRLIDAKNKAVLWSADFDETQESLLSNILTFNKAQSRGFKWVTVETLISQGLQDRLADCPFLKK